MLKLLYTCAYLSLSLSLSFSLSLSLQDIIDDDTLEEGK